MQIFNSFQAVYDANAHGAASETSVFNGRWKNVSTSAKLGGTAIEIKDDYLLDDGRLLATMTSNYTSSGKKLFNKEVGGVVDFKSDFQSYLDGMPLAFEFKKAAPTRKKIERIAAKIEKESHHFACGRLYQFPQFRSTPTS
jgi:hypothetical protein